MIAFASSLDQAGPMGLSAADCALMLQAMAGGEPPLEAYPKSDRGRIATQQEELRDTAPETSASVAGDDQA